MRTIDTATEDKRLLRLFWKLALWFCVFLPLVNGLGLNTIAYIMNWFVDTNGRLTEGSRLFWEICINILEPVIGFARIFFHFFGYGLFVLAIYRFGWKNRNTWAFGGMSFACVAIYPLCGYFLTILRYSFLLGYHLTEIPRLAWEYITYNALYTIAVELGILLLILLCNFFFVRKLRPVGFAPVGKNLRPWGHVLLQHFFAITAVHALIRLVFVIVETVSLVSSYGGPESFGEVLSLVEPYFSLVLYSLVGYFTLALLAATAETRVEHLCPQTTTEKA